jgi:alpha-1,3-mannosyltransferase
MLYFGRWSVNKGLLECIDVLASLCRQQPETPWKLIIAGREYDLNVQILLNYAETKGVSDRIELCPNPEVDVLRSLIGRASYFLCMSRHEGFGIAPIEAISSGLIPLLSPIPPFVRLMEHIGTGTLLDAPTPSQQALQIGGVHAQMEALGLQRRPSREVVQQSVQRYSWEGVAQRYSQQYDHALGSS